MKDILVKILLKYKETTYQELATLIEVYRNDMEKPISTNIKLEDGPEFTEMKEVGKNHNLQKLSEHKNLKAGMISILSKKKSSRTEE